MIIIGQTTQKKGFSGFLNSVQRKGASRGGRVGKFFSSWNARSDRKQFKKTHTMGF